MATLKNKYCTQHKNKGATLVEFVVMFLALVMVVLLCFQLGFLYRAKATLNHATFMAARAGALDHAYVDTMRVSLANSLAPLYLKSDPNIVNLGLALAESRLNNSALPAAVGGARVEIISPTEEIFDRLAVDVTPLVACSRNENCPSGGNFKVGGAGDRVKEIPNDNLSFRDSTPVSIGSGSDQQFMSLQDANLLKIRSFICYELEVPLIGTILSEIYLNLFNGVSYGEHWLQCQARSVVGGSFIPLSSSSVVRMQTPIRCEGDLRNGRNCENLN